LISRIPCPSPTDIVASENFYRDAKKVKQLNIFKEGKAQRNAKGEITKAASYQSRETPTARVEPNRKWFSNSRVISQESLGAFREAITQKEKDPYTVLLKSNKLPLSLIRDGQDNRVNGLKQHQAKMTVETSPFAEVFGPKSSRKRVKLSVSNIDELAGDSVKSLETYNEQLEQAKLLSGELGAEQAEAGDLRRDQAASGVLTTAIEPIFDKGQSKRIWNELCTIPPPFTLILTAKLTNNMQTRSLIPRMLSCISWTPATLWEHVVGLLRSISRRKHHTSISCSS